MRENARPSLRTTVQNFFCMFVNCCTLVLWFSQTLKCKIPQLFLIFWFFLDFPWLLKIPWLSLTVGTMWQSYCSLTGSSKITTDRRLTVRWANISRTQIVTRLPINITYTARKPARCHQSIRTRYNDNFLPKTYKKVKIHKKNYSEKRWGTQTSAH